MESLVLFAKSPVLGRVKTRLAQERGARAATVLYTAFLRDTVKACGGWARQRVAADPNRRLVLYVEPDENDPVLAEAARLCGARFVVQPPGDLGEKLSFIFQAEFDRGARAVCAIGSDSPTLPTHLLEHAFRALTFERVVIGPSFDGGYWLIGAQRPAPDLFRDIPWSTPDVVSSTLTKLAAQGVHPYLLPFWYDVDEGADLGRLQWHLRALRGIDPGAGEATWQALGQLGLLDDGAGV
jgi:rSAM/selenodomain-associated transferase 1